MPTQRVLNLPKDGANLAWAFIGDLLITFSVPGEMTDTRMSELIQDVKAHAPKYVLGTGIGKASVNSLQRKMAADVFKGMTAIATVFDDRLTRGIMTALGWLGLGIKSYDWASVREAIEQLRVPNVSVDDAMQTHSELRALMEKRMSSIAGT